MIHGLFFNPDIVIMVLMIAGIKNGIIYKENRSGIFKGNK